MIKTIELSSGTKKIDFDPDGKSPYFYTSNEYVWIKNLSADTVYVSLSEDCVNGVDGTAAIAPYDAYMLILDSRNAFYAAGSGSIEVHTSDISTCPFKISQKGGDISASGGVVQLGGLQGGVPFSEVTVKGDNPPITGQELTVTACGGNMARLTVESMIKSHQAGTWNGNEYSKNGIVLTVNDDNSVCINGTATDTATFSLCSVKGENSFDVIAGTQYVIDGLPTGSSENTWYGYAIDAAERSEFYYNYTDKPVVISPTKGGTWEYMFKVEQGATLDNVVVRPFFAVGTNYTITPDSNPYTVPAEIYQQDGINTIYVTGEGEPALSVKGVKTNAAVKKIWDKLNELTTAIIVSNGEI